MRSAALGRVGWALPRSAPAGMCVDMARGRTEHCQLGVVLVKQWVPFVASHSPPSVFLERVCAEWLLAIPRTRAARVDACGDGARLSVAWAGAWVA